MSDLVKRLREPTSSDAAAHLRNWEAATRIEALEAALQDAESALDNEGATTAADRIRAVLEAGRDGS